jgi:hypothetical protein
MQGRIAIEDLSTQEVLVELNDVIIHQHIPLRSHIHLKNPRSTQKYPHLDIIEEDMNKIVCKESLGRLSHQLLKVKTKGERILKLGC